MFERYTEAARKSVFFARFDASAAGSAYIEATHLLLGILRGDEELATRLLGGADRIDFLRRRVLDQPPPHPGAPGRAELPLSHQAKRALGRAAEEAEKLKHKHIGAMHLLLGLATEKGSPAAALIREMGISVKKLRDEVAHAAAPPPKPLPDPRGAQRADGARDLTAAARDNSLDPLIGRDTELERVVRILLRRRRNWVALTGEPGVGKTALVQGLAQHIAAHTIPQSLLMRTVLAIDAFRVPQLADLGARGAILCVEDLFDLPEKDAIEAIAAISPEVAATNSYLIATGTPSGFARFPALLARLFETVSLLPPTETEAIAIVNGVKERYERFHHLTIEADAAEAAVILSRRFLSHRLLPDRALDLLDEACTSARVQGKSEVDRTDIEAALLRF